MYKTEMYFSYFITIFVKVVGSSLTNYDYFSSYNYSCASRGIFRSIIQRTSNVKRNAKTQNGEKTGNAKRERK